MKFNVVSSEFVEVAKKTLKGFNAKDTTSQTIFTISKKNEGDYLTITCYSTSTFFEGRVKVNSLDLEEKTISLSVDGGKLKSILSVLNKFNSEITFTTTSNNKIFTLSSGRDNLHLPIIENANSIRREKIKELVTVSADEFVGNVSKLSKVIDSSASFKDHPKYCLHLSIKNNYIEMMATNGINLSVISQQSELLTDNNNQTILIPVNYLSLLLSQQGANKTLKIIETDNLVGIIDSSNVVSLVAKGDMLPMPYNKFQENVLQNKDKSEKVIINTDSFKTVFDSLFKLCTTSNFATVFFKNGMMYGKNENQDVFQIMIENDFNKEVSLVFDKSLSSIFNLLTDTFSMEWIPNPNGSIVQFVLLKKVEEDNKVTFEPMETSFICASSHKGDN